MSLLLQALQKAAKNRESVQPEAEVSRSGLDLEPGEIQPAPSTAGPSLPMGELPPAAAGDSDGAEPSPQQAAAVLGAAAREPRSRRLPGFTLRPVPLFVGAAAVFLVAYGVYVYIAISNPSLLSGAPRSASRQPKPLVASTASSPAAVQPGAPMPDLFEPPITGGTNPAPAAPAASAGPANARETPAGAAETPAGTATGGGEANANLSLSSTDDLLTIPPSGLQARAARKRPAPAAQEQTAGDDAPRLERPKGRAGSNLPAVPSVPAEDRVRVTTTELPRGISARVEEAWGNAQRGRFAEAEAGYESVLVQDRRNIDALLGLASIAWQQGLTERAGEFYGRVVELDPQNAAAQAGLIGLLGMTDPVASETRLREMIAREPSGQLFFTLGNLHARQSQWAQAQRAFFQAFQTEPGNPDYAFNLAVSLDRLGQVKPALQYYRKAVELSLAQGRAGFDQKAAVARIAQLASGEEGNP